MCYALIINNHTNIQELNYNDEILFMSLIINNINIIFHK